MEPSGTAGAAPPKGGSLGQSRRIAGGALLLLPAGLMAYLAFNSGGFYPGPPAYVAVILCIALALRVALAEKPFEGIGWRVGFAAAAMSLYALETFLSKEWSHAPGVARVEFDLPLVYLLALVLFGSVAHRGRRLCWMLRALALAIVVICACGLVTRLLPHLWPTAPEIANKRLSFPLTYWNALGLLAAMGAVLCVHFASDVRERWFARVVAAAAIPVQACTLYFTFSRGGIAVALLAGVVYVLLGRPRALLSTLIAAGPPTAVAVAVAYHANQLATVDPTTPHAVSQGHHVAIVLGLCIVWAAVMRCALVLLDRRLEQLRLPVALRRYAWIGWACLAAAVVVAAVGFRHTLANDYQRFINPTSTANTTDLRARLTDPANDARIFTWRVAWHGFQSAPLVGHGAGTYNDMWAQHRPSPFFVRDAHSLYMETLDELGIVGVVLLLGVILMVLWGAARRVRGSRRPVYAATFAVLLAWALHAGIDWDWEMPALTVIFFALGGAVLAQRPRRRGDRDKEARHRALAQSRQHVVSRGRARSRRRSISGWRPSYASRVVLGIVFLALAVLPAFVWLAQRRLDAATTAYNAGNCPAATRAARSSISILGVNAQGYEIIAYCDVRGDQANHAIAAIDKAISLDPNNYDYVLDLAVIRAAAGLDPLSAARRAVLLNPRDFVVEEVWQSFRADRPSQWEGDGKQFVSEFTTL